MRFFLAIMTILLTISSCQTNNIKPIEGDLYFKLIDFQRFFDAPDSVLTKIETSLKTVDMDTLTEQDKNNYNLFGFMADKQLLRKPFVRLRLDNGEIVMVFLNSNDYEKIKDYNYSDLVRDNKKIRIKADVSELKYDSFTAYESTKLISIDRIDGKTYWKK